MPPHTDEARWFAEEVLPHEAALRAWLRNRFPTLFDVDDLVQESYARMLRARQRETIENPLSYLFSTARNAALDLFRRRTVPVETSAKIESVVEERPSAAETASASQDFELLQSAINALPPRCAEIMRLQKIHGLSNREIAARLQISIHTVNAQLVTGLMRCREYLKARGVLRGGKP